MVKELIIEEKERYEVISPSLNGYAYIHDFKTDNVLNTYDSCDLLNQQSKRIKELETCLDEEIESNVNLYNLQSKTEQENQRLKQELHDLPKKIMEEVRKNAHLQSFNYGERYCEEATDKWAVDLYNLRNILDDFTIVWRRK